MKKQTIEDLREEYRSVTGKAAAIRWNRKTLEKKIRDARLIKQADEAESRNAGRSDIREPNPEFEQLAGAGDLPFEPDSYVDEDEEMVETRGGLREGAGRKVGQSDNHCHIERLLNLQVPDIGVRMLMSAFSKLVGRVTGFPFDKKSVNDMSLGITRILLYWFPQIEGKTGPVGLHLESVGLVWTSIERRSEQMKAQYEKQSLENVQNGQEKSDNQREAGTDQGTGTGQDRKPKNRPARYHKSRSRRKTRP